MCKLRRLLIDHGGDARELVGLGQRAVPDEGLDRAELVHLVVDEHGLEAVVLVDRVVVPVLRRDALQLDLREGAVGRRAHLPDDLDHGLVVALELVEARVLAGRVPAFVLVDHGFAQGKTPVAVVVHDVDVSGHAWLGLAGRPRCTCSTRQIGAGIKNPNHALNRMEDGDFHGFMKEYMENTCPCNGWDNFDYEIRKYRNLSKALKLCGYYSEKLDLKTQEVSQGVKDLKVLANEAKKKFAEKSTKERVEFSFKQWLYGPNPEEGVRKRQGGACDGT